MYSVPSHFFSKLTFDSLASWAGESVFQRGRAYHKAGHVHDVALTHDGGLLATIRGTRKYITLLFQEKNGKLASLCTCPYGARCKHAVALACAGLALLTQKAAISSVDADDNRLLKLERATAPDDMAEAIPYPPSQKLEATLDILSKKQLIALLMQAVSLEPEVATLCLGATAPQKKDVLALVKDARKAMRKALEEPDWDDWDSDSTQNYEPFRKKLETLRVAGFPAEVLDLGRELIEDSVSQIEMYDNDGELQGDIAGCMEIVLQALHDVDWPLNKKLLWAAEAVLSDEFAVCDCFREILHEKHPPEAWNSVADSLLQRLAKDKEKGFPRRELVEMAALALDASGRGPEVLKLHKQEATQSEEYLPLVKYLLEKDADSEAEEWIQKGIAALEKSESYKAERLRSCLLDLRKKQKDWDCVVCMQAEDFVDDASLRQFKECRQSAEKLKVWPVLYPLLMDFLIERKIPWLQDSWPCRSRSKKFSFKGTKHADFDTLIAIAIDEKNPADVLHWYDLQRKTERGYAYNADSIADAIRDHAPDRAISLWKGLAEKHIALVKPSAYVQAAVFLRKMKKLMHERNMTTQWDGYMCALRDAHRRKTRLMEVLDGLTATKKQSARQGR